MVWCGMLACAARRRDLRRDAMRGHATLIRASDETKHASSGVPPRGRAAGEDLAEDLRQKFDPKGILNPGLMG